MMKPQSKDSTYWPSCSFFAIYDGHGGCSCADFLRDNLHYFIINDENFPANPKLAMMKGFEKAEQTFLEKADNIQNIDRSGSCAIVVLLVDQMYYTANLGDSRALASKERGNKILNLSEDHKPNFQGEEKRITQLGGKIYQSQIPVMSENMTQEIIKGPFRVFPGRLAVSRTFGDIEAKLKKYNGIPNVVSAEPEIVIQKIDKDLDFIVLACDGIFDKLTNNEIVEFIWQQININQEYNIHQLSGQVVSQLIKQIMLKKGFDNLTIVIIGFQNLQNTLQELQQTKNKGQNSDKQN